MCLEWNDAYKEVCQETGKSAQVASLVVARLNEMFDELCETLNDSDVACCNECLNSSY